MKASITLLALLEHGIVVQIDSLGYGHDQP